MIDTLLTIVARGSLFVVGIVSVRRRRSTRRQAGILREFRKRLISTQGQEIGWITR
jgi:hypothetical protein